MKSTLLVIALAVFSMTAFAQQKEQNPDFFYVHFEEPARPLNLKEVTDRMAFPEESQREGIEGKVLFRVLVDAQGHYRKHQVVRCNNGELASAAAKELDKLKFSPAKQNGKEAISWTFVPVHFKLSPGLARSN